MVHSKSSAHARRDGPAARSIPPQSDDEEKAVSHMRGNAKERGSQSEPLQSLQNLLPATQKAMDALVQVQQQWLQAMAQGGEPLAEQFKALQEAKDPADLVSAQVELLNQQIEQLASRYAAVLQQMYDAQLFWLGQWDEKPEPSQASDSGNGLLRVWGQAQDEWLRMTRSWIDTLGQSATRH